MNICPTDSMTGASHSRRDRGLGSRLQTPDSSSSYFIRPTRVSICLSYMSLPTPCLDSRVYQSRESSVLSWSLYTVLVSIQCLGLYTVSWSTYSVLVYIHWQSWWHARLLRISLETSVSKSLGISLTITPHTHSQTHTSFPS